MKDLAQVIKLLKLILREIKLLNANLSILDQKAEDNANETPQINIDGLNEPTKDFKIDGLN